MSLIFDALLRSEAEQTGVVPSTLAAATDVLRQAEDRALSERAASVQLDQVDPDNAQYPNSSPLALMTVPIPASLEAAQLGDAVTERRQEEVFGQFRSLAVSAPLHNNLVCLTDGESLAAEKFRFLGISLQNFRRERPLKRLLITSTIPQEGKSTVSANLACTLAKKKQQRTLLLEGDIRRPSLSKMFGVVKVPGLCEYLQGECNLLGAVYHLQGPGFWFLPAGEAPKDPLQILQSGKLSEMMDQLAALFDWIIIDSPPVMPLADTSVWMRVADGILLVLRQGVTQKKHLKSGLEAIEHAKLIGALMNGSNRAAQSDYYYGRP